MYKATKKKVHGLLHPEIVGDKRWDKIINIFIITLIILNVIAVMLETVPSFHDEYHEQQFFKYFDLVSVIIFTVEYLLRIWSSNHDPKYAHSIKGRLKYMLTPAALIDLMAILPFYLHAIIRIGDLRVLRMLRLLRFFRLFRLTAYTQSAQIIKNVFKKKASELLLSLVLIVFLIVIASCIIYFVEHDPLDKTNKFNSIPATIWWAVVTLTTTGYGDMYPITTLGRVMAGLIMLTGVAIFALPAGIITVGFLEEFRKNRKAKSMICPHCGEKVDITEHVHEE